MAESETYLIENIKYIESVVDGKKCHQCITNIEYYRLVLK